MRLNRTDVFATTTVGLGVLAYALWLAEVDIPRMGSARVTGAAVLGLGWLASAVAVVPNFDELIHSSRVYVVVTSLLGVAALTAGVVVLVNGSAPMLAVLVSTTVVMWVLATVRHTLAAQRRAQAAAPAAEEERQLVGSNR